MPNPNEEKLAQFVNDTVMFYAVKSILEAQFDLNSLVVEGLDNDQMGERTRACLEGRDKLRQGFRDIEKFRAPERAQNEDNPNQI